jgi:group I intron endonuclease
MGYIYILTSPNGKPYIGQTFRPIEKRLEEHQLESSGCVAIRDAIKKYGWDNFEKDWYYCPDEDLNKHEELMVEVLGTLSPDGYNLKEGGDNGKLSEETKQKMRKPKSEETKQKMRKPKSDKHRQNIGKANIGKKTSEKTKQKLREINLGENHPMWGKTPSKETKQKISDGNKGKTRSNEIKQKISGENNHKSKRVYQYDLDGTFLNSFGSTEEAGQYLEKESGSTIRKCAYGKYKTAYNFKWSYAMDIFI